MDQLTVRGFGDDLAERIQRLALREGKSLNQTVLTLLRKGAGLREGRGDAETVGSSLDHLIGTWTQAEADEMDAALEEFEKIDGSVWE